VRYQQMSDFVFDDFPDNMKLGVLGDWGTGSPLATRVLERMLEHQPDVIIHLGDVYYAGEASEYGRKLLAPLAKLARKADGTPIPIFNMCGNHDMYSGGTPFYEAVPQLNSDPAYRQQASYFCLRTRNRKWQVLAGDTGLHDHDPFSVVTSITHLDKHELAWHLDKVQQLSPAGGRTIFMTHHQPFSAFIPMGTTLRKKPTDYYVNPRLLADFAAISAAGEVPLWLWGHEHNLGIYQPFRGIARGRCAGHSAVPVLQATMDPYKLRQCSKLESDAYLVGLLKGRWGSHLVDEYRAWRKLRRHAPDFPVPQLVQGPIGPVKLPIAPDRMLDGEHLPPMYEHGFTFFTFGAGASGEQVQVDYYAADNSRPLYSETL
jgi:hypothetical protein